MPPATPRADGSPHVRTRFGPGPISLFPTALLFFCALPLAGALPVLSWLLLLPAAAAVWVLRARVVVTPEALLWSNGLRRHRTPWPSVEGFDLPRRGPVRLLHEGQRSVLTAVPRHELGQLVRAAEQVAGPAPPAT
ncbi:MAG TPA: PH domain-containing protein [Mycobacteriales bacterium]|nr:PH domain-containing protein [Mycobacteriales bacterium]